MNSWLGPTRRRRGTHRFTGRFLHAEDDLDELLADADHLVVEDLLTLRLRERPGD